MSFKEKDAASALRMLTTLEAERRTDISCHDNILELKTYSDNDTDSHTFDPFYKQNGLQTVMSVL